MEDAASAAEVYATVLADDPQPISLSKASHAVTRVLWQQRFFTQALGAVTPALAFTQAISFSQCLMFSARAHISRGAIADLMGAFFGIARPTEQQDPESCVLDADPLVAALQRSLVIGRPPPTGLLLGLAQLVAAAPAALVGPAFPQLLPWLLEALRNLQDLPGVQPLLSRLLVLIAGRCADAAGAHRACRPSVRRVTLPPRSQLQFVC